MSQMMTRVFVKREGARAWPARERTTEDGTKEIIRFPTKDPVDAAGKLVFRDGQFCKLDGDVDKFIEKEAGERLWEKMTGEDVSGQMAGNSIWQGNSPKYYQNIMLDDVINLLFDFDDLAPDMKSAQQQETRIREWFMDTVREKLGIDSAEATDLVAISSCTRPDPSSIEKKQKAVKLVSSCDKTSTHGDGVAYNAAVKEVEAELPWKVSLHITVNGYVCNYKQMKEYAPFKASEQVYC